MKAENSIIAEEIMRLVDLMRTLRSPEGCSWDRKQTHESLADNVLEEAQEVVDAIKSGDDLHVREELGDLLMMVVFNAQIASEAGKYDLGEVARGICSKLIHRHPHVFGDATRGADPEKVMEMWGEIKKQEKLDKGKISHRMREALSFPSALSGAEKIQSEAAVVGFDFPTARVAAAKIREEAAEVENALDEGCQEHLEEEIGDLLFSVLNVTRLSGLSAEKCLRQATGKFVERFAKVEKLVLADGGFAGKDLAELDKYWDRIKLEK